MAFTAAATSSCLSLSLAFFSAIRSLRSFLVSIRSLMSTPVDGVSLCMLLDEAVVAVVSLF